MVLLGFLPKLCLSVQFTAPVSPFFDTLRPHLVNTVDKPSAPYTSECTSFLLCGEKTLILHRVCTYEAEVCQPEQVVVRFGVSCV